MTYFYTGGAKKMVSFILCHYRAPNKELVTLQISMLVEFRLKILLLFLLMWLESSKQDNH